LPAGQPKYGLHPLIHGRTAVDGCAEPVDYTLAIPEDVTADTIAIGINGLGAFKRTSRGFRTSLAAQEGIPTLTYEPKRRYGLAGDRLERLFDPQRLHADTLQSITDDLETREDLPTYVRNLARHAPYTLIPHSMGELPAMRWLERSDNADKTGAVIHLGALGLARPSAVKLLARTGQVLFGDVAPGMVRGDYGQSPVLIGRSLRYFLSNPTQTAAEIVSCFRADVRSSVQHLAELGIPQAVVALRDDGFFKPEETFQGVGEFVDEFVVIDGTHTAPQRRAAQTARQVGRLVRQLL
jgi:hypothetical protein